MKKIIVLPIFIAVFLSVVLAQKPQKVWIIIGVAAGGLHCDATGCTGPDGYWTGKDKLYAKGFPKGWSPRWKDAKQYIPGRADPNYDIPNGRHCCYSEVVTPIDPKNGKTLW